MALHLSARRGVEDVPVEPAPARSPPAVVPGEDVGQGLQGQGVAAAELDELVQLGFGDLPDPFQLQKEAHLVVIQGAAFQVHEMIGGL